MTFYIRSCGEVFLCLSVYTRRMTAAGRVVLVAAVVVVGVLLQPCWASFFGSGKVSTKTDTAAGERCFCQVGERVYCVVCVTYGGRELTEILWIYQ